MAERDELLSIASDLEGLLARLRTPSEQPTDEPLVFVARRYRDARMRRPSLFGNGDSADPAWDILIDLYIAEHEGRDVSVSSAAIASLVPPTTGLRWIDRLIRAGLIVRERDPSDGRRILLRLTNKGAYMARSALAPLSAQMRGSP